MILSWNFVGFATRCFSEFHHEFNEFVQEFFFNAVLNVFIQCLIHFLQFPSKFPRFQPAKNILWNYSKDSFRNFILNFSSEYSRNFLVSFFQGFSINSSKKISLFSSRQPKKICFQFESSRMLLAISGKLFMRNAWAISVGESTCNNLWRACCCSWRIIQLNFVNGYW